MDAYGESLYWIEGLRYSPPVVDRYTVENGNWPLITKALVGHGVLTYQPDPVDRSDQNYPAWLDDVRLQAFRAVLGTDNGNENNTYSYQTQGKSMFGEGPYYFEIALRSVVPFLHAARTSGVLAQPSVTGFSSPYTNDPFTEERIVRPMRWLARISTPDGQTPTLDDANKWPISAADLLKWSGSYNGGPGYGDAETGRLFSIVARNRACRAANPPVNPNTSACTFVARLDDGFGLLQLAIPQRSSLYTETLPAAVVNTDPDAFPNVNDEQQLVRRFHTGGQTHPIVLNGEVEIATGRGESHEQADNMQLLYYVDDLTVLGDEGYDCGAYERYPGGTCVDLRFYNRNSVMLRGNSDGGLPDPSLTRSTHTPITRLHSAKRDSVYVMTAVQYLDPDIYASPFGDYSFYRREVLFVNAPSPFLIDLNRLRRFDPNGGSNCTWKMRYNVNSVGGDLSGYTSASGNGYFRLGQVLVSKNRDTGVETRRDDVALYAHPTVIGGAVTFTDGLAGYVSLVPRTSWEFNGTTFPMTRMDVCDDGEEFFSVATLFEFGSAAPSAAYRPVNFSQGGAAGRGGFVRQAGPATFDVFVARSVADGTGEYRVNPREHSDNFPNVWLGLPTGVHFGYARVQWTGSPNAPVLVPGYTVNLVPTTASPLQVALAGPGCAIAGQPAHFSATASGGLRPHTNYKFEILPECSGGGGGGALAMEGEGPPTESGEILPGDGGGGGGGTLDGLPCGSGSKWSYAGGGANPWTDVTQHVSYRVRVTVTDNNGPLPIYPSTATSMELPVSVGSWCPGEGGASQTPTETPTLASDATVPTVYGLDPPVPNPFASRTRLRFALPEASSVRLVAYDVLGRQVAVLAEGPTPAGWHEASLDGAGLPRGLYVVRLTAGTFTQTRTVTLAR